MKLLFVNNVSSVIGGTLACTLSMCQAFPDCEITVFSWGRFGETEYRVFPKNVNLVSGPNLREFIGDTEYDVIVYQNTGYERMPHTFNNKPLTVYYQHSDHRSAKQARELCNITLCVSKYLADQAGLDESTVLYQPVTVPPQIDDPEYDEWAKSFPYVIGRICSPNPNKWKKEDVVDVFNHVTHHTSNGGWHFIGCPDWVKEELEKNHYRDHCYFSDCSFEARGYLHKWDYLLYKSSLPETYGRVVKEAQRCRCVPIVSDLGGFKEQIEQHRTGYLCGDLDDFLFAAMDEAVIDLDDMKEEADLTGSCKTFRQEFLKRLNDYCSR